MPPARPARSLDAEAVHESHRRLRAELFWFRLLRPDASVPSAATSLRHAMGRVRNLDVAIRELPRWIRSGDSTDRTSELRRVRAALRAESRRRRAQLRTMVREHPDDLGAWTAGWSPPVSRALGRARVDVLLRLERAHRRALTRPTRRRLHRVRKRIRELGLLNAVAGGGGPASVPRLGPQLRRLAHDLGRLNDRATLIRWLSRRRDGPESKKLVKDLRLAERRARRAAVAHLRRIRPADWPRWAAPPSSKTSRGR